MTYEELKKRHEKMMRRAGSEYDVDEDTNRMEEPEDEFYGVEFDYIEKYTTIFKMSKTGVLSDEECDV
jgi:hypothetical protein